MKKIKNIVHNKYFILSFYPIFSVSAFIFSEWVFMVTKPSFMSGMSIFDKLNILILSIGVLIFGFLIPLILVSIFIEKIFNLKNFVKIFNLLISSIVFSLMVFLMIDNFTYTIFSFGVVTVVSFFRLVYGLLFIIIFINFYKNIKKAINKIYLYSIYLIYVIAIFLYFFISIFLKKSSFYNYQINSNVDTNYPNIIFLTADGLNAKNMSLYGYKRNTTPNIDELAKSSLIANNMFTNSGNSFGSITSLFTGKYPMQTRVIYNPDILKGKDTIEHLPMILRKAGYMGYQYSIVPAVDVFSVNMVSGFNYANGRSEITNKLFVYLNKYLDSNISYFVSEIYSRISSRILHILFIYDMDNINEVVAGEVSYKKDKEKIDTLIENIIERRSPVFGHVHWMGTHGVKFYPENRIYSINKNIMDQSSWDDDFYDDSIIEFDMAIGELIDKLKECGEFNRTIIVITSDHGQRWSVGDRIPLLIHFPNDDYRGVVDNNVQIIDIAPTLIEYLGFNIPNWMQGNSILKLNENKEKFIFYTYVDDSKVDLKKSIIDYDLIKPPFYQFLYLGVRYCNNWYSLNLSTGNFDSGPIDGVKRECNNNLTNIDMYNVLRNKLYEFEFDVSSLNDSLQIKIND